MTLYPSTGAFAVGGQHYEGFPILVDASGVVVEVVLLFFVDELIRRAGAQDLKTCVVSRAFSPGLSHAVL